MKALVLEKKGLLTLKEVDAPIPFGTKPILVRIAAVGICGSDILRYAQGKVYHFPLILGHEFSAIVEKTPHNSKFSRGDHVAVYPLLPDYHDPFSCIGEYNVSSNYDYFGSRRDGALTECLFIPEANLISIPVHIPLLHAAVAEPAAVALHGIRKFKLPANATALVIGGGPIGSLAAQWLRILGCDQIFIADVDQKKCDILSKMGFYTINAAKQNTVSTIMNLTGGKGVNCTVESCGIPQTFIQAIESAGIFGQVLILGDINREVLLKDSLITTILRHELTLYGTWNSKIMPTYNSEWDMVFSHMGKGLQVAPLISHTPSLREGPSIFSDMASKRIWYNKVVFAISEEVKLEINSGKDCNS